MNSPIKNWRETKKLHQLLGKKGKIIAWTKIFVAPIGFEAEAPYVVAIVQLEGGKRITAQVVECDEQALIKGQRVITVVRRIGKVGSADVIDYGVKVKPI